MRVLLGIFAVFFLAAVVWRVFQSRNNRAPFQLTQPA